MKNLLLTTAMITIGATGAALADTTNTEANTDMNATSGAAFASGMQEGQIRASDFIGMRVYAAANSGEMTDADGAGQDWEDIGEINDVVMNRDGQVESVLVDIGGFLGIGERQVAANLSQVKFVSDSSTDEPEDFFLVMNVDPETLDDAPEYSFDSAAAEVEAETEEAGEDVAAAADTANQEMEEAGDDVAAAADEAGEELNEAGEDVAAAADEAGQEIEEGAEDMAQSAEAAGEELEAEAEEMAATDEPAGEELREEDTAAATTEADADTNVTATADADASVTEDATATADASATVDANAELMTAENLDGARVYDSNDKWIGEISELIITEDGQITDAIVDVGGFLGIGEKPVALKLSDLKIMRQDGGDEIRVYTAMMEAELESMPEFEKQ
ncbi:PRC-barrel domain-containing protein [Pseudooceanicola onchidii]|uniref:PRC-barrel domain-containing protein n=1 Tax=Pseudooceanicola onchidii TaxID=2562279 RepID=UPI00145BD1FE|nr:PRC-barrel domain-containing protein [Pseudooceanicola onchidii]